MFRMLPIAKQFWQLELVVWQQLMLRDIFRPWIMDNRPLTFIILFVLICLIPCTGIAKTYSSFGPITTRNQNPFYLQTINLQPMRAKILAPDTLEVRLDSAYSNIFENGATSRYWLRADMELWRIGLNARYAPRENMEVGVELPFIHTWGGFLDPFIQKFHNFFGFPNAGRNLVPDNQFMFRLQENGQNIYNINSQKMGLGDLCFYYKQHILAEQKYQPELSWFFQLKFPTGAGSRGLGNGNLDYGFGLALEKSYKRFHAYLNTAYYVASRDDALVSLTHDDFFSYMAAFEVTLLPTWSVIAQLNGQTPQLTGTQMGEWDGVPLDLTIGFKGEEPGLIYDHDLMWQFGFAEDITSSGPSVDFTVFLSIGMRFVGSAH
ncbi:MAG: DUF3187 family protein [Pseudomonadota bacterium]